jgi:hypothetical protein
MPHLSDSLFLIMEQSIRKGGKSASGIKAPSLDLVRVKAYAMGKNVIGFVCNLYCYAIKVLTEISFWHHLNRRCGFESCRSKSLHSGKEPISFVCDACIAAL